MESRGMIIANSTPLINFAAIRRLDVLENLFKNIYIPLAVESELLTKGERYPTAAEIRKAEFIKPLEVKNTLLANTLKLELDDGEADAIVLALEQNGKLLLLDELAGRIIAENYGIPFTGSIGCLVEAKRLGIVSKIKPMLDDMQDKARFWINPSLYHRILETNEEL
jgi:predicted nucleic acid-binding protein